MAFVFHIKDIHENIVLDLEKILYESNSRKSIQLMEEEKESKTLLNWFEMQKYESRNVINQICTKRNQSVLSSEKNLFKWQVRRNNMIEFRNADVNRMITQTLQPLKNSEVSISPPSSALAS